MDVVSRHNRGDESARAREEREMEERRPMKRTLSEEKGAHDCKKSLRCVAGDDERENREFSRRRLEESSLCLTRRFLTIDYQGVSMPRQTHQMLQWGARTRGTAIGFVTKGKGHFVSNESRENPTHQIVRI